jgi:hypothetical protein
VVPAHGGVRASQRRCVIFVIDGALAVDFAHVCRVFRWI